MRLYAPDRNGKYDDVVLGYKDAAAYRADWMNIGATVGRCANRIRGGVALETQFYPDAIHHPDWPQPVARANEVWTGKTDFVFKTKY